MKKIVIALLVAVMLTGLMPVGLTLAEDTYATVYSGNSYGVRLREGPATTYAADEILPSGTTVTVLEVGAVWTRIQAGTRTGYMMSKFLVAGGTSSGITVVTTATVYANNGLRTWLRATPNGKRLGLYSDGTPVNVLEYGDGWCRVMIGSSIGYMMTTYLVFAAGPTPTPAPTFAPLTAVTVNYPYPLQGDTLLPVTTPGHATVTCVWQWVDASGAVVAERSTNTSYAVSAADVGHMIKLTVTGTGLYAGASVSYTTEPVTASKAITGVMIKNANTAHSVPVAGDVLSATLAPSSATVTYSWRVAGVVKGTESTYTVAAADAGKAIQLYVTGTGSFTGSASSEATAAVADATTITSVKLSTQYPIVGAAVGAVITPSNATATYVWYVNGAPISTASTYTPNSFDLGDVLSVKVTGSGKFSGNATSADSDPISRTLLTGVTINNTNPSVGSTLKAVVTPTAAQDDGSVLYQWYRVSTKGEKITGATGKEYIVATEDVGKKLYVVASGDGVYGGVVTSAVTAVTVTSPVLTGVTLDVVSPVAGDTITAKLTPELNAADLAKCTFIWQIGSSRFVGGQTYTVGKSDVGYNIRVQVNPGGGDVVTSAATSAVVSTYALSSVSLYTTYTDTSKVALAAAPVVGQTLIAKVNPIQADSKVIYTWSVGAAVVGKGSTYTVAAGDMGKVISVSATDSGAGAYTGTARAYTAAVATTYAQQIDLRNAITPKAGAMPVYKTSGTLSNGVTYSAAISWSPALAANGTFKNKETYTAKLTFTFSASYYVLGGVSNSGTTIAPTINGNVATCEYDPLVETQVVTNLNIAGLTAPVVGAVRDTDITDCTQYTGGTVSWTPDDSKFVVGQNYTATIPLTARDGYTFTGLTDKSSSVFTVLGAESTYFTIGSGGATATVTANFAATATNTSASVTASRLTVPVGSSRKFVQCTASLLNYSGDQSGVSWKWELSGAVSSDTVIDDNGLVTVALDETTGRTLTVTATTQNVKDKSGKAYSASLTLTTAAEAAVTGLETVNIISAPNEIATGASGTFAAEVLNANNEVVVWSVSGVDGTKHANTKINGDGVLTISANETVKQLAVTARSVNGATSTSYVTVVYTTAPVGISFEAGQKSVAYGETATFKVAIEKSATTTYRNLTLTARVASGVEPSTVADLQIVSNSATSKDDPADQEAITVRVKNDASLVGTEIWISATYTETTAAGTSTYKDIWSFIVVEGENASTAYNLNVTPGTGTIVVGKAGTTQTFTASVSPAVDGATIQWSINKGSSYVHVSPTTGDTTTLTVDADRTENTEIEVKVEYIDTLGTVKTAGAVLKSSIIAVNLIPDGGDKSVIYISPSSVSAMKKGDSVTLKAVYGDGTDATGAAWSSDNTAVATVSDGVVDAVSAGTATITADVGGKTATIAIQVKASLNVKSGSINAKAGDTVTITAEFDDPTNNLVWSSAQVDVSGLGKTGGSVLIPSDAANGSTVTITATSDADSTLTASCSFSIVAGRTVTVTGGVASTPKSGSGNVYEVGETVTLQAKVPTGATFKAWEGLGSLVADPTQTTVSFKMPGDRSLNAVATFNVTYTVTVTNGKADKAAYMEGDTVTITANPAQTNMTFAFWSTSDIPTPTGESTTFTMPAKNVALTAVYANTCMLTVTNGAPTGKRYTPTTIVPVTANADPNGGQFARWVVTNATMANLKENPGMVTIGTVDATATAIYDYNLAVSAGTGGTVSGGGRFEKGAAATITATPAEGYKFDSWTISADATGYNANSATTTLTMKGTGNVSAQANFSLIAP